MAAALQDGPILRPLHAGPPEKRCAETPAVLIAAPRTALLQQGTQPMTEVHAVLTGRHPAGNTHLCLWWSKPQRLSSRRASQPISSVHM